MKRHIIHLGVAAWLAAATQSIQAAEIDHEPGKSGEIAVILITGEIKSGDEQKFRELSVRYPEAIVGLDSDGGAIVPALEIGRMIRLRGYITAVLDDAVCTSACALIWLAGNPRMMSSSGQLGFHATYKDVGGRLVETGVGNAMVGHYLSQLNLPEKAVIFATSASPYEISWLNESNRYAAGIDFTPVPPKEPSRPITNKIASRSPPPSPPPPVYIPPPVTAPSKGANISAQLRSALRKPGLAEQVASQTGLSGSQRDIAARHISAIFANDRMVDRLASELRSVEGAINGPRGGQIAMEISGQLQQRLLFTGLLRLSDSDIERFVQDLSYIALHASDDECGKVFWPSEKPDIGIEFRIIGRKGDNDLGSYLALIRKAVFAELDQTSRSVRLTPTQAEAAEAAGLEAILAALGKLRDADASRMLAAMDDLDHGALADRCGAMRVILYSASGMPGITGDWYRRWFIELSQSE